jgi:transposase
VEACTGWLFVARALERCGAVTHLAEPIETSALRGRKRRAKTDRAHASWLRQLLLEGRLPESWMPPEHVRQWRSRTRLRNTLAGERTSWVQRIRATLYHHGIAGAPDDLRTLAGRQFLAGLELPVDARERIKVALEMIDLLEIQIAEVERELRALARRQPGCRALMDKIYGVGELSSLVTLRELGDVSRLHASRQAVRLAGIDIGVHRSDRTASLGKLTRQGSPDLRWALYEAAQSACRKTSPDHADYRTLRDRGLPHPRQPDDRPQARPPQLPRPAPARTRRAAADRTVHSLRSSPHINDAPHPASGQLPQRSWYPPQRGDPPQTERPESLRQERPINHLVTGRQPQQPPAQIRQDVHGADHTNDHLNPSTALDTPTPFR